MATELQGKGIGQLSPAVLQNSTKLLVENAQSESTTVQALKNFILESSKIDIATPQTVSPNTDTVYLAFEAGYYNPFDGNEVREGELVIFKYDTERDNWEIYYQSPEYDTITNAVLDATPTQGKTYLLAKAGTYTNFNLTVEEGEIAVVSYKGSKWQKDVSVKTGGGGTTDYTQLTNKPAIGGITLEGNKTAESLGLQESLKGKNMVTINGTPIPFEGVVTLPGGEGGGAAIIVDPELNPQSTNAIQNKAVATKLSELDNKILELVGMADNGRAAGCTKIGDIYYNTKNKNLRKATNMYPQGFPSEYGDVAFIKNALYRIKGCLYYWNDIDLLPVNSAMSILKVADGQINAGVSKIGDVYFSTKSNTFRVADEQRESGDFTTIELKVTPGTVCIDTDSRLYVYNGIDMIALDNEDLKLNPMMLPIQMVVGSLSASDGSEVDSLTRMRSELLFAKTGTLIQCIQGYKCSIRVYRSTGEFINTPYPGWHDSLTIESDCYVRIIAARENLIDGMVASELPILTNIERDVPTTVDAIYDYVNLQKREDKIPYTAFEIVTSTDEFSGRRPKYTELIKKYDDLVGEYPASLVPDDYESGGYGQFPCVYKVTRRDEGKDQSGSYNIYSYTFEPASYKKTVYFNFLMHGDEEQTSLCAYQLLKHLVDNDEFCNQSPVLTYMRKYVKLIVVGCLNPWGLDNNKNSNSRGVNPNRNFAYRWSEYDAKGGAWDNKGSAAFSEAETKIFRDICIENAGNLDFVIDYHTGASFPNEPMFYFDKMDDYVRPALFEAAKEIIKRRPEGIRPETKETTRSLKNCWVNRCLGIPSATIEYGSNVYSEVLNSAEQLKPFMWNLLCYWTVLFSLPKRCSTRQLGILHTTRVKYDAMPIRNYSTIYVLDDENKKKMIGDVEF